MSLCQRGTFATRYQGRHSTIKAVVDAISQRTRGVCSLCNCHTKCLWEAKWKKTSHRRHFDCRPLNEPCACKAFFHRLYFPKTLTRICAAVGAQTSPLVQYCPMAATQGFQTRWIFGQSTRPIQTQTSMARDCREKERLTLGVGGMGHGAQVQIFRSFCAFLPLATGHTSGAWCGFARASCAQNRV